jgi:K+/H+ antiporter YhaU regulatory subunit KhtT
MDIGQVSIAEKSPLAGRTIAQTNLRQSRNVNILAVQQADGELIINPNSLHVIQPGEVLIVIGPPEAIYQTEAELDAPGVDVPPDPQDD